MAIGSTHITRGNNLRLQKSPVKHDLRKFGLPNWVVCLSANTINTFESSLQINFGKIMTLCIILKHSCTELEVVVYLYTKNLSKL